MYNKHLAHTDLWHENIMAKTAIVTARIDLELKKRAERIFAELGLTAAQAITLFYQQVDLHDGLPFDVRLPNAATKQALADVKERRILTSFNSVEELFDDLNA
jgi:DNA-damage-inducible protein J